jgi:hypothetical protein
MCHEYLDTSRSQPKFFRTFWRTYGPTGLHADTLSEKNLVLADVLRSHYLPETDKQQVSIAKLLRGCFRTTVNFGSMGRKRQAPEVDSSSAFLS